MKKILIVTTLMFLANAAFCQSNAFQVVKTGKSKPVLFLPGFTTPDQFGMKQLVIYRQKRKPILFHMLASMVLLQLILPGMLQ